MKKRYAAFLSLLIAASSAYSFDFGLVATNDSDFLYEGDWAFKQTNEARLWISVPVGANAALFVSGLYEYTGTFTANGSTMIPYRFDVGRTEFEGSIDSLVGPNSVFRYSIGRIAVEDFSGRVMSNLTDGLHAELSLGNLNLYLGGGYRGLTYKEDARSLVDADDSAAYKDSGTYFAPKRAVANAGARFNEIFTGHDIGLDAWGQYDFESGGTATHTAYAEPFIEGRVGRAFRWRAWCVAEFGYDVDFFKAMAAGGTFRFSVPEFLGLRVTGNAAWASGAGETFRAFSPIRQKQILTVAAYPFSDIVFGSMDVTISPLSFLALGASAAAVFRSSTQAPSEDALSKATLRANASGYYLGFEPTARAALRVSSDLSFVLSGGVFIPNTTDVYAADSPLRWKASLNAVFSL